MSQNNNSTLREKNPRGTMRVQVPASVDVKGLVKKLNLSSTLSYNIKNKVYYFLSLIVSTNDNYELNENNNGYRNISSVLMKKIVDKRHYGLIIRLLTDPEDPVIETNGSWSNSKPDARDNFCKGYRLTEKYNTGEVVYKTLPVKFQQRITKHIQVETDDYKMNEKYKFLLNQFEHHRFTIDPLVYDYIRSFGEELHKLVVNGNAYQTKLVYNQIGRWLDNINNLEKEQLWYNVSSSNHRLNSSFTSLPRLLRPFILCDGRPLSMVDVSSSQPYILCSVMTNRFFTDFTNGYNLFTICPEIFQKLVRDGYIEINSDATYPRAKDYYSSFTGMTGMDDKTYVINLKNSYLFMWGQNFTTDDLLSIKLYQISPFDNDFYTYLVKSFYEGIDCITDFNYPEQRKKLKDTMMLVFFDMNPVHRKSKYIKMFSFMFPGVDKWIKEAFNVIGNQSFSYLLQRTESYLLLHTVAREFNQRFPEAPLFTIHDGLYTHEEYIPDLTSLILERLEGITGISVGVKKESPVANPVPKIKDIDEMWKEKIKSIITQKKYEEVKGGVFTSNVVRGTKFLNSSEKSRNFF